MKKLFVLMLISVSAFCSVINFAHAPAYAHGKNITAVDDREERSLFELLHQLENPDLSEKQQLRVHKKIDNYFARAMDTVVETYIAAPELFETYFAQLPLKVMTDYKITILSGYGISRSKVTKKIRNGFYQKRIGKSLPYLVEAESDLDELLVDPMLITSKKKKSYNKFDTTLYATVFDVDALSIQQTLLIRALLDRKMDINSLNRPEHIVSFQTLSTHTKKFMSTLVNPEEYIAPRLYKKVSKLFDFRFKNHYSNAMNSFMRITKIGAIGLAATAVTGIALGLAFYSGITFANALLQAWLLALSS